MIKLERNNLQAFCRTCLQRLEATSVTAPKYGIRETPNLMKLLILCTTLNINEDEDDVYPQILCTKCYQTLQEFQRFRDMALQSNEMLREIVENEDGVLLTANKSNDTELEKYTIQIKSEAPADEELIETFKAEDTELTSSFYVYDIDEANVPNASANSTKNSIETCDDENTASSDAQNRGDASFDEASTSAHALKRKRNKDGNDTEVQSKKRLAGRCASTLDMWSDVNTRRTFLTCTLHFLDSFWHFTTHILFTIELEWCDDNENIVKQPAENIIRAFNDKFEMIKLGPDLHKNITYTISQESDVQNILQHHSKINCMTHTLSTILKNTFDKQTLQDCAPTILDLITKCVSLVEYLERAEKIHMLVKNLKKGIVLWRWKTKFDILFAVSQNFNAIRVLLEMSGESQRLIDIEKHLLDRLLAILELFKLTTELFECKKKPTIQLVLLHMHVLKEQLLKLRNEESHSEIRALLSHCLDNVFEKHYQPHNIHKIGAFLWPQYKQLRFLNFDQREEVYRLVREELNQIVLMKASKDTPSSWVDVDVDDMLTKYKDIHPYENSSENQINIQMELYRGSRFNEKNTAQWWRLHGKTFPLIAKLARHILCIAATNAASESCFSSDNRLVEERKTTLIDENLDKLLFLHSQFKQ